MCVCMCGDTGGLSWRISFLSTAALSYRLPANRISCLQQTSCSLLSWDAPKLLLFVWAARFLIVILWSNWFLNLTPGAKRLSDGKCATLETWEVSMPCHPKFSFFIVRIEAFVKAGARHAPMPFGRALCVCVCVCHVFYVAVVDFVVVVSFIRQTIARICFWNL